MPPADQADPRTAAPGAICPPVPDLPGGQASVNGFAEVVVTRVNSNWSGGLPDEEVAFGFGSICWGVPPEPRRHPGPVLLRPADQPPVLTDRPAHRSSCQPPCPGG
jgi:hypothetical protein